VPVASLFGEVEAALAPLIAQQRQAIAADIAPEAATIAVDAAKMHDVLRNLVENASRHAPEQSTITLRARRIDDRVTIEVADEGPGIPESDLSRVFERFYRVDKARARGAEQGGGTGLGLAIVKHLVGLHGGTVAARNGERGAVFTVSLPA
jgi:signal transduction histidine kinase